MPKSKSRRKKTPRRVLARRGSSRTLGRSTHQPVAHEVVGARPLALEIRLKPDSRRECAYESDKPKIARLTIVGCRPWHCYFVGKNRSAIRCRPEGLRRLVDRGPCQIPWDHLEGPDLHIQPRRRWVHRHCAGACSAARPCSVRRQRLSNAQTSQVERPRGHG